MGRIGRLRPDRGRGVPTRDEPPDVRAEAGDAVNHYSDRVRDTFRDLADSVEEGARQLNDWLRSRRDEEP